MALQVGVNVLEVDGKASPAIPGAPTSVSAFLGRTERGIPDEPVRVTSSSQFRDRFGSHLSAGFIAYAVDGFFLNGGREAYICRVVGGGTVAASTTLNNRDGVPGPALRVSAGYRGREDPGSWGERLRIEVRDDPRASTSVAVATGGNATSAQLRSIDGLSVGSVVRLVDAAAAQTFRRVTGLARDTSTIQWSGPVVAGLALDAPVVSAEFRLVIRYRSGAAADLEVVEEWEHLSMENGSADYVVDRLNHPFTGSRYTTAVDLSGTAGVGVENPAVTTGASLTGGTEVDPAATDYTGDSAAHTGLFAFDTEEIQLLAVPDAHGLNDAGRQLVVRGALDYCAMRGTCMFVGAAPDQARRPGVTTPRARSDYDPNATAADYLTTVKRFSATFQGSKVFGALYAPWIRVVDPIAVGPAPTRYVPPDGHLMGVYARVDQERGIWKAPAGTAAQLRGALDISADFSDGQHTDLVKTGLVNGVRATPGFGIVAAASRTLSSDTRWWFVNVRLLFNFVKVSLRDGLRFVRQEPHSGELRRKVKFNVVTPFLLGLWRQGAFGSDAPEHVFTVVCDATNNPPADVDLGIFRLEVYFYPVKPAETVVIVVGQQPSGGSASEA